MYIYISLSIYIYIYIVLVCEQMVYGACFIWRE